MKTVPVAELEHYVGQAMGVSTWLEIDQDRIDLFADAGLDRQYIHVDPERAKQTPFGGTIAHGFLTLSLLSHLHNQMQEVVVPSDVSMAMNYGFNKIRFLAPVKCGAKIRGNSILKSVTEKKPGQYLFELEFTVEIEGETKPALIADWLILYMVN